MFNTLIVCAIPRQDRDVAYEARAYDCSKFTGTQAVTHMQADLAREWRLPARSMDDLYDFKVTLAKVITR